ncbi:MAG: hypothetical protein Q9162_006571 [Coniocarpon cinnabarinum]
MAYVAIDTPASTSSPSELKTPPYIFSNEWSSTTPANLGHAAPEDITAAPQEKSDHHIPHIPQVPLITKPGPITPSDLTRLISHCAHPTHGSTRLIEMLLSLHPDPQTPTYHAALRALAVHPSPFLLHDILSQMSERWISVSPSGRHDVAVCLIRNTQLEEALEYIEDMENQNVAVKGWLYDMLLYSLLLHHELDEATRLLRHRISTGAGGDININTYYLLFDAACERLHYPAITLIWTRQVRADAEAVKPTAGHCLSVLRTAARNADVALAEQAMQLLNKRGIVLGIPHYELLLDAHVGVIKSLGRPEAKTEAARQSVRMLEKAVRVIVAMGKAGLTVTRNSTRNFLSCLTQDERSLEIVARALEHTHTTGSAVPVAAVDTLLEGYIHFAGLSGPVDTGTAKAWLDKALALYRRIHILCQTSPGIYTFNVLLNGCVMVGNAKSEAMYLAREMVAIAMRPNAVTYDRLVLVCLRGAEGESGAAATEQGEEEEDRYAHEDAFRYLQEMEGKGWIPRAGTLKEMVETCARAGDERAWELLEKMRQAGYETKDLRAWLEDKMEEFL